MTGTIDSRKHNRVAVSVSAEIISASGERISTITRDISFSGISLESGDGMSLNSGDKCEIEISLSDLKIVCECRVAHKTGSIVGFEYLCIADIDSYNHLKNLIVHNSSDPGALLEELAANPGIVKCRQ